MGTDLRVAKLTVGAQTYDSDGATRYRVTAVVNGVGHMGDFEAPDSAASWLGKLLLQEVADWGMADRAEIG